MVSRFEAILCATHQPYTRKEKDHVHEERKPYELYFEDVPFHSLDVFEDLNVHFFWMSG